MMCPEFVSPTPFLGIFLLEDTWEDQTQQADAAPTDPPPETKALTLPLQSLQPQTKRNLMENRGVPDFPKTSYELGWMAENTWLVGGFNPFEKY